MLRSSYMGRSGNIKASKATALDRGMLIYLNEVSSLDLKISETDPNDPRHIDLTNKMMDLVGSDKYRQIVLDMASQFQKRGNLSPRQTSFLEKIKVSARDKAEERKRLPAPAPVPETDDWVLLRGEVLSIKWKENHFGGGWKMVLVDDSGFRVYGSVARGFLENGEPAISKGDVVGFKAKLSRSDDDPNFGFFKNPEAY